MVHGGRYDGFCKEFVCTEGQARPIPRDCRSEKLEAGQRILTTETLIKAFSYPSSALCLLCESCVCESGIVASSNSL